MRSGKVPAYLSLNRLKKDVEHTHTHTLTHTQTHTHVRAHIFNNLMATERKNKTWAKPLSQSFIQKIQFKLATPGPGSLEGMNKLTDWVGIFGKNWPGLIDWPELNNEKYKEKNGQTKGLRKMFILCFLGLRVDRNERKKASELSRFWKRANFWICQQ